MKSVAMIKAKTNLGELNQELFISSDEHDDNQFILSRREKTLKASPYMHYENTYIALARIYERRGKWYVWYFGSNHREEISKSKPFTEALRRLEKEFTCNTTK